jgi:2,4-dienoyl-CoA reductase (NADPH2)
MHTGLEDGNKHDRLAAYFAERARGGVGLIITGGYAPNRAGWVKPFAGKLTTRSEAAKHRQVTDAVHAEEGKIAMQILHAGRYAYHPLSVAPSRRLRRESCQRRAWKNKSRRLFAVPSSRERRAMTALK